MSRMIKGVIVVAFLGLAGFSFAQKAAPGGSIWKYSFTAFNSSQKNMHTHGVLADGSTGKMWMLITATSEDGGSFYEARPVAISFNRDGINYEVGK